MLDFEVNVPEPSRRSKHQVVFEEEDNEMIDLAFAIASVSASYWEANIDDNESIEFAVPPSVD